MWPLEIIVKIEKSFEASGVGVARALLQAHEIVNGIVYIKAASIMATGTVGRAYHAIKWGGKHHAKSSGI